MGNALTAAARLGLKPRVISKVSSFLDRRLFFFFFFFLQKIMKIGGFCL